MKSESLLLVIAVVIFLVSVFGSVFTYVSISNFKDTWLTGFATTGEANLTVETQIAINFTNATIAWGSGRVNGGSATAELFTAGGSGTVTAGNWTAQSGLILENLGNVNVTVDIKAGKTPANFIGGTNPGYEWNVTAFEASNFGATCLNITGNEPQRGGGTHELATWYTVNTSGVLFCKNLSFVDGLDSLRIDLNVTIPRDSLQGALSDIITVTIAQG